MAKLHVSDMPRLIILSWMNYRHLKQAQCTREQLNDTLATSSESLASDSPGEETRADGVGIFSTITKTPVQFDVGSHRSQLKYTNA